MAQSERARESTEWPLPAIEALGDSAWLLRFGSTLDAALNARVHECAAWLVSRVPPGEFECVPAFASLALHFDPERDPASVRALIERVLAERGGAGMGAPGQTGASPRTITIPCCYGGEFGPDLDDLARHAGLSADEVVRRHAGTTYQVAMLGFQPGFPYLLGLDPGLAMPRLSTPRAKVPAGSVAIGASQCGIYPRASPGGWRLIGRTPATLFDARRGEPALLRPGDHVRFRVVAPDDFARAEVEHA
jgi:KipI family sensor histidine kinase inhibitor